MLNTFKYNFCKFLRKIKIIKVVKVEIFPIFITTIQILLSQESEVLWQKTYDSGYHDIAIGITIDKSDNIYITGQIGTDTNWDCLTIKYDPQGNIVWAKSYDSGKNDLGYAITTDNNNSILIAGQIFNGINYDYLLLKYNSEGDLVWQKTFDWGNLDGAYAIATDNNNNIYLVGQSSTSATQLNYLTLKLDPNGYILWQSTYPKSNQAYDSYGVSIDNLPDGSASVYMSGYSNNDFLVVKYNSIDGTQLWAKKYNAGVVDFGQGITVDNEHNFYLTGQSFFSDVNKYNCYTIKCNTEGEIIWQTRDENTNNEGGFGISIDTANYVYVCGSVNNGTDDDFLILKYDPSGKIIWRKTFDTGKQNKGYGITLNKYNNFIVSGYCLNSTYDCLLVKYKQFEESPNTLLKQDQPSKENPVKPAKLHFGSTSAIKKKINELEEKIQQEKK